MTKAERFLDLAKRMPFEVAEAMQYLGSGKGSYEAYITAVNLALNIEDYDFLVEVLFYDNDYIK